MPSMSLCRASLLVLLSLAGGLAVAGCGSKTESQPRYATTTVQRGTVRLTASADGVIEPIRKVEVKSKASGEIIQMAADTGDDVKAGQLLVQLLPRDAQNSFDQAVADLQAAQARLDNAQVELNRSRSLFAEGLIAQSALDIAELAVTTAKSDVVRATKAQDNAAERLAETTVRSPIDGTVLAKSVEVGQVVSSAVSQVSGGTLLLTLADLTEVQVRSLVDEVDIGKLRAGLPVVIRVEAFPDHEFRGEVLKIEPQAVVQQNVTLFPVLTRIDNRDRLLKPGMNAEIEVLIDEAKDVLMVANEALKTPEETEKLAAFLDFGQGTNGERGGRPGPGEGGEAAAATPATPREAGRDQRFVFLPQPDGSYRPVAVEVGLKNWEVSAIRGDLPPGTEVALLPSAAQLRQSEQFRQRMQRMGGMPGMTNRSSSRRGGT